MNPSGQVPRLISVYDDEDFRSVHKNPGCTIECPRDGCGTRLVAKTNSRGTRWLATHPASVGSCDHHEVPLTPVTTGAGGGEESAEHRWMKTRIARVCTVIGYDAFIEHQPTHADVFIEKPQLAVEYQRWDSDFTERDLMRTNASAKGTLWFFPPTPRTPKGKVPNARVKAINDRVFRHGGIFIEARHKETLDVQHPWEHPGDFDMNRSTRLYVSGSVVTYDADNNGLKHAGTYSLHYFLRQVIEGERTLQEADVRVNDMVRRKRVWVRQRDLDTIAQVKREKAERTRVMADAAAQARADRAISAGSNAQPQPIVPATESRPEDEHPELADPEQFDPPTTVATEDLPMVADLQAAVLATSDRPENSTTLWERIKRAIHAPRRS